MAWFVWIAKIPNTRRTGLTYLRTVSGLGPPLEVRRVRRLSSFSMVVSGAMLLTVTRTLPGQRTRPHVGSRRVRSTGSPWCGDVTTRRMPRSRSTPLWRQTNSPGEKSR